MHNQFILFNDISFLLTKDALLDMTINNPIFIFSFITVIWFIPGIIVKRFNETKQIRKKIHLVARIVKLHQVTPKKNKKNYGKFKEKLKFER